MSTTFGPIPLGRVRMDRYPATEQDVLDINAHEDRNCELIDDILVERLNLPANGAVSYARFLVVGTGDVGSLLPAGSRCVTAPIADPVAPMPRNHAARAKS